MSQTEQCDNCKAVVSAEDRVEREVSTSTGPVAGQNYMLVGEYCPHCEHQMGQHLVELPQDDA